MLDKPSFGEQRRGYRELEGTVVRKLLEQMPVTVFHRLREQSDFIDVKARGFSRLMGMHQRSSTPLSVAYFSLTSPESPTNCHISLQLNTNAGNTVKLKDVRGVQGYKYEELSIQGYDGVVKDAGFSDNPLTTAELVLFEGEKFGRQVVPLLNPHPAPETSKPLT